jgi:hypothetical protein
MALRRVALIFAAYVAALVVIALTAGDGSNGSAWPVSTFLALHLVVGALFRHRYVMAIGVVPCIVLGMTMMDKDPLWVIGVFVASSATVAVTALGIVLGQRAHTYAQARARRS